MSIAKKIWILMGLNDAEFQARMNAVVKKLHTAQAQSVRDARRLSITTQELFYGMTVPMGLFAGSIIDATKRIESLHKGLTTIARSKGINNIEELIKSTTELAKLPGLGLEETFAGVRNLIAVGFNAKEATESVMGLGIGIARAGGNAETFGRVMIQLTQALAKNKLEMQDFKTVFEQMPESRGILEKAFGPGMSDLDKLRKAGIGVRQVVGALVDGFKELGAAGFMDSLSNKIENLKDNWLKFRAALGEKVFKDQIHGVLDAFSKGLEKATKYIDDMSPGMKDLIGGLTMFILKMAIIVPAVTFMAKMFLLLKAQAYALAGGLLKLNPYVLALQVALIGIEGVGRLFIKNWKGIGAELWDVVKGIVGALAYLKTAGKNAAADLMGNRAFANLKGSLPIPRTGADVFKDRSGGRGMSFLSAELGIYKKLDDEIPKVTEKVWKIDEAIKNLTKTFMHHGDIVAGFAASMPGHLQNMSGYDMGKLLFANDRNNDFTTKPIQGGLEHGIQAQNLRAIREQAILGAQAWGDYYAAQDKVNKSTQEFNQVMAEIFTGPIAQGITAVSDAFGTLVDTALKGGKDAFGAMAKAMGTAIKQMIIDLVKLIAKLLIAYALFSIFAPAGAGKGLTAFFDFAKGGKGFLGSLLKNITGFDSGGVVGGNSYYGDKIMARVNSGEVILNKRQQAAAYSQMNSGGGTVFIRGELRARGRDLVYVLEENQVQLNSAR